MGTLSDKKYRLYVVDGYIHKKLGDAVVKAIDESAPKGSRILRATGFRNLLDTLENLSAREQIQKQGHIADLTIVAHGGSAGSFRLGNDLVGHSDFNQISKPFPAFADHARIDILRCAWLDTSTSEDRRSLLRKVGTKLLPNGGRVCGLADEVQFFEGGGVRLEKQTKGTYVPVGGRYPTESHSLELLKLKPQECVELPGPNEDKRIFRTLRRGMSGQDVKRLQQFLGVTADSDFGSQTERALKKWQRDQGLVDDGVAGSQTHMAIRRTQRELPKVFRSLRRGSQGTDVKKLQQFLGVTADGDFGSQTEGALKKWQGEVGLTSDGVAGQNTFRAINRLHGGNPAIFRSLQLGSSGEDVRCLQGIIGAKRDGIFGKETQTKLISWQNAHNLRGDGIAGPNTLQVVQAALTPRTLINNTLRMGSRGEDVRRLQGIIGAKQDGIFGKETQTKLIGWQKAHNLRGDGVAGPNTLIRIHKQYQP